MPGGAATGAFGSGVVKSATGRRPGRRGDVDAGVGCGIGAPNDHIEVVDVRRTGVLSPVDGRQAAAAAGIARLGRRNDGLETEIADILAAESDLRAEAGVAASSIIVTVAGLLLASADSESPPLGVLPSTLNANSPLSARSGIFGGLESRVASAKALPISCSISSSTASILPFFSFICGASRSDSWCRHLDVRVYKTGGRDKTCRYRRICSQICSHRKFWLKVWACRQFLSLYQLHHPFL